MTTKAESLEQLLDETAERRRRLETAGRLKRVLIIEDNVDAAESLRALLQLIGHQVAVAYTGPTGIETARAFRPDVVLCDIGLPGGMDGYAVARALRQAPDLAAASLLALTGHVREEDQRLAVAAGFDRHLAKPINLQELERLLTSLPVRA